MKGQAKALAIDRPLDNFVIFAVEFARNRCKEIHPAQMVRQFLPSGRSGFSGRPVLYPGAQGNRPVANWCNAWGQRCRWQSGVSLIG